MAEQRLWAIGLLGLVPLGACEASGPASQHGYLSPSARDEMRAWPGVGEVRDGGSGTCSGTLVHVEGDRGLVLTAAHCVLNTYRQHGFYGLAPRGFRFGPNEDVEATVGRVAVHPRFEWDRRASDPIDPWPVTLSYDFAVFEVSGLPLEAADWMIPIAGEDVALVVGDAITVVGFGSPDAGFRQVGVNVVGAFETLPRGSRLIQTFASAGVTACPGDSGGPNIVDTPAGPRVIGVHSSGAGGDCGELGRLGNAVDAREALALVESIATGASPPRPQTCVACAATSGICTETKQALVESLPANWESCIRGDGPGDDFETCSERFPATRTAYDAHWSCLEASCGDAVCTDVSRIFTLCEYSQDGGGACDACIMASCCERTAACMNDPTCSACASTTTPDAACRANTTLQAMYACLGGTCEAECGEYVAELVMQVVPGAAGDAGSPDAGGSVVGPTADGSTTPSAPSGCSCRTGQHRSASLGIVWALVAWLGARRRRPSS